MFRNLCIKRRKMMKKLEKKDEGQSMHFYVQKLKEMDV